MEKLIVMLANVFLSVFFTMLIFCTFLGLEFSLAKVFAATGFIYIACGFWKRKK